MFTKIEIVILISIVIAAVCLLSQTTHEREMINLGIDRMMYGVCCVFVRLMMINMESRC